MSDRPVSSEPLTGGHPPLAVAMAKAIHDVMPHYLPWPHSLTPCPAWERHLGMTAAVIEHPIFAAAARSATPSSEEGGALQEAVEQWVELFHAHKRGDDLGPIFDRHIEAASEAIRTALGEDQ